MIGWSMRATISPEASSAATTDSTSSGMSSVTIETDTALPSNATSVSATPSERVYAIFTWVLSWDRCSGPSSSQVVSSALPGP